MIRHTERVESGGSPPDSDSMRTPRPPARLRRSRVTKSDVAVMSSHTAAEIELVPSWALWDRHSFDRIAVERRRVLVVAVAERIPDAGRGTGRRHDDLAGNIGLVSWIPQHQRRGDAFRAGQSAIGAEIRRAGTRTTIGDADSILKSSGQVLVSSRVNVHGDLWTSTQPYSLSLASRKRQELAP